MTDNFTPGETISVSATTTSASASFALTQSASYPDCMVTNAGSQIAFVGFNSPANTPGSGQLNAVPIPPGETTILQKGIGVILCSAVTASGTTTLYFTAGQGN